MRKLMSETSSASRSREIVVVEILSFLETGDQRKSHVAFKVKTNGNQMNKVYEPFLFENGLVSLVDERWHITKKGQRYLAVERQKEKLLEGRISSR